MKTRILLPVVSLCLMVQVLLAATTINVGNQSAYAANLGWLDWRGDTNNGAFIGEYVCSGYIYSANVGWINLGVANFFGSSNLPYCWALPRAVPREPGAIRPVAARIPSLSPRHGAAKVLSPVQTLNES